MYIQRSEVHVSKKPVNEYPCYFLCIACIDQLSLYSGLQPWLAGTAENETDDICGPDSGINTDKVQRIPADVIVEWTRFNF